MDKIKINPATQQRPASKKQQRNARIRDTLTKKVEVQEIPALEDMDGYQKAKPRVCAYCRVSTDMDTQALSYELQVQNYTEYINSNENWEFAGIYADKGISGTSLRHRDDFNRMIADCREGKIDLIVTKAVTRFARNRTPASDHGCGVADAFWFTSRFMGMPPAVERTGSSQEGMVHR